jgi:hypothetical protein
MQKELEALRSTEKNLRGKLRDMELDNDDLEKNERCVLATIVRYVTEHVFQSHLFYFGRHRVTVQQSRRTDGLARARARRQSKTRGGATTRQGRIAR